jgi:hypothetical protein
VSRRRKFTAGLVGTLLIAGWAANVLTGCYIPSGLYRIKAKVVSAHTKTGACRVEEREDGWTVIHCPYDAYGSRWTPPK